MQRMRARDRVCDPYARGRHLVDRRPGARPPAAFRRAVSNPVLDAAAIRRAREHDGRLVAVGTTVVRALEHAASRTGRICGGEGLADQRVDANSRLRVVDVILSGTHEPDTSHYQLLRAFLDDAAIGRMTEALETHRYRTHEFGDSVLIERMTHGVETAEDVDGRRDEPVATAA